MESVASITFANSRRSVRDMPGYSDLFADYCEDFERLSKFFAAEYRSIESIENELGRIRGFERDRDLLADTLHSQNEAWGMDDATRQNIERLRNPSSVAVVTGQQVGLFGGPLYTIYKTATAVQLARQLSATSGQPVVPVFWLEGEDHDLDEVKSVHLLSRNEVVALTYDVDAPPAGANHGPVGRIKLTEAITNVVGRLEDLLPTTEFKSELLRQIREAYRPGVSMRTAFARLLKNFFRSDGLVFISPDDRRFKVTAIPLFKKEVDECRELADAIVEVSNELRTDYHAQVSVRPTNLFLINDRGRFAIDAEEDGSFAVRGQNKRFTSDALKALIDDDPCCISPNVVLRPILQDRILPTAAYVGGPGEVAYFAQFKPAYQWADQPMPVIYPRASATILETKVQKLMDEYGLNVASSSENINDLFRRVVMDQMHVDLDAEFAYAARHLHEGVNAIKSVATGVDATLGKAVESTRAAMAKEWKRLEEKVLKAEKRRHDEDRMRLTRLQHNVYPNGKLQERNLSVLYFLNKYGPGFIAELQTAVSLDTTAHQVLKIQSPK